MKMLNPLINKLLKPLKNTFGFTILEVLVTIGILSLISGIVADTFFNVYRTYQKSNVTNQAKQSGEQILSIFEKAARDASSVEIECLSGSTLLTECALPSRNIIKFKITKKPQRYTEIGCVNQTTSTNGYIYQKLLSASSSELLLTNSNLDTGVNVANCDFSVTNKVARIDFVIKESINAPARIEFKTDLPFDLTVVLRNQ